MKSRANIMGILNVTPDSFYDGGNHQSLEKAVRRALSMVSDGADIIDIGGESTRPGADTVSVAEELQRTVPIIRAIRYADIDIPISIDTRKPEVAVAAIDAGAHVWNDVSGLTFDERSARVAAELGCPVILMHAQGTPKTMQDNPQYGDPVSEISDWFKNRIDSVTKAGVDRSKLILDPGIGFGKRARDNFDLLSRLDDFHALGCPLLVGASRKSFIADIDASSVNDRMGGSIAAALWANAMGAEVLRVHDVKETAQALALWDRIYHGQAPS